MTLADRIVVLNGGRVEQVGAPLELYKRPRNLFVARFHMGSPAMNLIPVKFDDHAVLTEQGDRMGCGNIPDTTAVFGIRPEDIFDLSAAERRSLRERYPIWSGLAT